MRLGEGSALTRKIQNSSFLIMVKFVPIKLIIFLITLSFLPIKSYGWSWGESSYEECILKRMKNVKSDEAARSIRSACFKKFDKPPKKKSIKKGDILSIFRSKEENKSDVYAIKKYIKDIEKSKTYNSKWVKYGDVVEKYWSGSGVDTISIELTSNSKLERQAESLGVYSPYFISKDMRNVWIKNLNSYAIQEVRFATGECNSGTPDFLSVATVANLQPGASGKVQVELIFPGGDCYWVHESFSKYMSFDEVESILYE